MNRQAIIRKNIFENHLPKKELVLCRIYFKNSHNSIRQQKPNIKWVKVLNYTSSEKILKYQINIWKKCSTGSH